MASSLQAQLAALSGSSGKHPGSTFATNKRHDEAIGRGVDYHVQQGQVIRHYSGSDSLLHRATLVYETPRQAADVPLSTLQEECVDALNDLTTLLPALASAPANICGPTDASPTTLHRLILHITILLGENDTQVTTQCLQVLEYLLRRYQIHQFEFMEDLVWTLLPHHQQLANAWHRCLMLVDLASHSSYLWLRPYADPQRPAPTPRALVAHKIMTERPLLQRLCALVRQADTVRAVEPDNPDNPLRGWSHIFSWAAAILVEGLVWTTTQPSHVCDRDGVARILVPAVRAALSSQNDNRSHHPADYLHWGCVVGSTLAETFDLAPRVLGQWGTALLSGPEPVLAWSTLTSMLLSGQEAQRVEPESYLPLYNSSRHSDSTATQEQQWLGCPIPKQLLKVVATDCCAVLGYLQSQQGWEVTPLVVGLWVIAVRNHELGLAEALVAESSLAEVWRPPQNSTLNLIPSLAAYVTTRVVVDQDLPLNDGRVVLQSLVNHFGASLCAQGVSLAAQTLGNEIGRMSLVKSLVAGILTLLPLTVSDNSGASAYFRDILLPPRIALEHADVHVRRRALQQILASIESFADDTTANISDGETLMETLVRRWSVETDPELAQIFAKAIIAETTEWPLISTSRAQEQCLGVLDGAHRWMGNPTMADWLSRIVRRAAVEANEIMDGDAAQLLQEVAVSLVEPGDERVSEALKDTMFLQRLLNGTAILKKENAVKNEDIRDHAAWNLVVALKNQRKINPDLASLYLRVFIRAVQSRALQTSRLPIAQQSLKSILGSLCGSPDHVVNSMVALSMVSGQGIASLIDDSLRTLAMSVTDDMHHKVSPIAVTLEATLRSVKTAKACKRLVNLAAEFESENDPCRVALVPSLVLLSHPDKDVREASIELITSLSSKSRKGKQSKLSDVLTIFQIILAESASIVQVGLSLPGFLARCVDQLDSEKSRVSLLDLAFCAIIPVSSEAPGSMARKQDLVSSWLSVETESSTREAGCEVLEAMESAGENAFPLPLRWKEAGYPLYQWLANIPENAIPKILRVAEIVARQIKGVLVSEPQIVLSSGSTGQGTRSRSYSVGHLDELETLYPYPQEMVDSIESTIKTPGKLRDTLVQVVLRSKSWSGLVFPQMESQSKKRIVQTLLRSSFNDDTGDLISVANTLPLNAHELADIMGMASVEESSFPYLALLIDYFKATAPNLVNEGGITSAIDSIFNVLENLSNLKNVDDTDGLSYVVTVSLAAVNATLFSRPCDISSAYVQKWVDRILSLMGTPRKASVTASCHILSWRGRSLCLAILTSIGQFDSRSIVEPVTELALNLASKKEAFVLEEVRAAVSVSIPILWANIDSSPRTMTSFLMALLESIVRQGQLIRDSLLCDLLNAMCGAVNVEESYRDLSPGIIAAVIVAMKNTAISDDDAIDMISVVFDSAPVPAKISSLSFLVDVSKQVLGILLDSPMDEVETNKYLPSGSEIMNVISAPRDGGQGLHSSGFDIITASLSVVNECAILEPVQKLLRKRSAAAGAASVQLWQNLLLIYATAEDATTMSGEKDVVSSNSWRKVALLAEEVLETVQANISGSVFFAAVRSLLSEGVAADLRARALRFAADRAVAVDPEGPDRSLFVDLLSDATKFVADASENVAVRQSALVYIEHTTRTLFRSSTVKKLDGSLRQKLHRSLSACSDASKSIVSSIDKLSDLDVDTWNLLSSIALAASTLVETVGISAISKLGGLLKSLIVAVSYINKSTVQDELGKPLVQLSALRFFASSTKAAPQGLFGCLDVLLTDSVLFCESLRQSDSSAIQSALQIVDDEIASSIPARLLIPALVKFVVTEGKDADTMMYVFDVLSKSVSRLGTGDGGIFISLLTKAFLKAFECKCPFEIKKRLVSKVTQCVIGLVLKLSEVQFLRMYGDLSEWMRQDLNAHRFAFWSVSEVLSRELKTIFLPCASMVIDEIVKDLDTYAVALSRKGAVEVVQGGKKRRKKGHENQINMGSDSLQSLLPLLGMISTFLRADAQSGGKWTREHGRYHSLLEPLSKLLHCQIPEDFPMPPSEFTPFEFVVEENENGSVVGCLTSLALAAGDEQLWKPLNHAILEACGNATRSQVRKGGIVCLLSLIRNLGEEYMVLLPECLPVLAELLEDENEVVAGLSRDAISAAEELLGESLEANLK